MLVFFPKLVCFPFLLSLVLHSHFPLLLTFSTGLLPRSRHRSTPISTILLLCLPARSYLSELRRNTSAGEFNSSLCSPFSSTELLVAATSRSSSTATSLDKIANHILKHIPRSGIEFCNHVFKLSWYLHSFSSIWKTPSIIPIHKMRRAFEFPAFFRPSSLTFCISMFFERIILSRVFFCLDSNFILSHCRAGSAPNSLPSIRFDSYLSTFRMD